MRCAVTCSRVKAGQLGLPEFYEPRCSYDQGHEGDHALVWQPAEARFGSGRVVSATFTSDYGDESADLTEPHYVDVRREGVS